MVDLFNKDILLITRTLELTDFLGVWSLCVNNFSLVSYVFNIFPHIADLGP